MNVLIRSTDPVLVDFVSTLLREADIPAFVFDEAMSMTEGAIGILPRRIMVADEEDLARSREILAAAGLAREIALDDGAV